MDRVKAELGVSERVPAGLWAAPIHATQDTDDALGDEAALTADIIALARQYGRYGYPRITALLAGLAGRWTRSGSSGSGGVTG